MFPIIKNVYTCTCHRILIRNLFVSCRKLSRFSENDNANYFAFKTGLSPAEQSKILGVLNTSNPDKLLRYNVSKKRIKSIEVWTSKKGKFKSFSDVLEVDGFGEKILEKICKCIINGDFEVPVSNKAKQPSSSTSNTTISTTHKKMKHLTTPLLLEAVADSIVTASGIHLTPTGISWAQVNRQNKLTKWSYENFSSLPNKMGAVDIFNLVVNLIQKIPPSDIYVLESQTSMSPKAQQTVSYNQQAELTSMLLALLNTSLRHNVSLDGSNSEDVPNKVYFLRNRLPARLFGLILGSEKIASVRTVNELLSGLPEAMTQPCSPVIIESQLKDLYDSQSSASKDLLGHALLLILSFMDVCVYKNPTSINALFNNNWKKKS